MVDDVKRALDCGVLRIRDGGAPQRAHLKYAYKWPLEKAIRSSIEATAFAHANGLEVVFLFPIEFSRAEMNMGA